MTEDEAKTKACPFMKSFDGGMYAEVALPGGGTYTYRPSCIASDCMAWRDHVTPTMAIYRYRLARKLVAAGEKISAIKAIREVWSDIGLKEAKDIVEGAAQWHPEPAAEGGYCGLAGQPS